MAGVVALGACSSPSDGGSTTCPPGDLECFLDHLQVEENGQSVELVTIDLSQLESTRPITVFATMRQGGQGKVYGYDGAAWTQLSFDGGGGAGALATSSTGETWVLVEGSLQKWDPAARTFRALDCPALPASGSGLFAVPGGVLIGGGTGSVPTVHRFDANGCTGGRIEAGTLTGRIISVWSDGTESWAIDTYGTWRYTAGAWARYTPGDTPPCCWKGVWATSANDVWLYGGTLRHWTGTSFQPDALTGQGFYSIAGSSPTDLWAASATGLMRYNGTQWTTQLQLPSDNEAALWVGGATDVWRLSRNGVAQRWDGSTWTTVPIPLGMPADGPSITAVANSAPPSAPPTATSSPSTITLAPGTKQALDISWTDPYGARPSFCFSPCSPSGRCIARASCMRGFRDGLQFGHSVIEIGYSAAAESTTETIKLRGQPVVLADGSDPIAALTAHDTSHGDVIAGAPFEVLQMIEPAPKKMTDPGGGTCSGGGLYASRRSCIDLDGRCQCTNQPTDSCIAPSEFTSAGHEVPSAPLPLNGTGCIFHSPTGNNFLVKPCAIGLSCKSGPICGGANDGTCLP